MKSFKHKFLVFASTIFVALFSLTASATFYPNQGDIYYNGLFYKDSYFLFAAPVWSVTSPGYEHDLWVHNNQYFPSTCTSMTNLPNAYDDCPTAGTLDPNGPVFSFGTFNANNIVAHNWYFGAWQWTQHNPAITTTGFNLQGQENKNNCFGIPTIWCMFATQTQNLVTGWLMVWGGTPSIITF